MEAAARENHEGPGGHDEVLTELATIFCKSLNVARHDLDVDKPILSLGADSLLLFGTINPIYRRFGIRLKLRQFFVELPTVRAVSEYIRAQQP